MNERLWFIEQGLEDLMDQGAQAELDGDTEAAAAFYRELEAYLTKEAAKVTSYVGLIRSREATAAAAKLEEERIRAIRKAAEADVERLKANALAVMQRFDVKELRATPGGGLRRQGNGGLQAMDVPDETKLSEPYRTATVKMSLRLLRWFMKDLSEVDCREVYGTVTAANEPAIREALKQRVPCMECKAHPGWSSPPPNSETCPRCKGETTIPASVPGARLLPRGEHVKII